VVGLGNVLCPVGNNREQGVHSEVLNDATARIRIHLSSFTTHVDIRPDEWHSLGRMPSQKNPDDRIALLQGTLDLLILKTLVLGPCHGQGVARSIQRQSEEVFFVDHGSLYLALQRLEDKKWISAKWGVSENNRKARFYSLTAKGREQLVEKTSEWERLTRAMGLILGSSPGPSSEEA
jgi:PadR family transcriptional regulator PadR